MRTTAFTDSIAPHVLMIFLLVLSSFPNPRAVAFVNRLTLNVLFLARENILTLCVPKNSVDIAHLYLQAYISSVRRFQMARRHVFASEALGVLLMLLASVDYYFRVSTPPPQRLIRQHVEQRCEWVFSKYVSSPWEYEWHKNINRFQNEVCAITKHDEIKCDKWIQSLTKGGFPMDIFSYFVFDNNCTNEVRLHFIEPLVGLTRHPYFCLHGEEFLVNKDYMLIYPIDTHQNNYYFDLGASTYTSGAGGSSQSWFVETAYPNIRWDGIYCWESSPVNAEQVWAEIPGNLKPVYHWYNIPVNPAVNHSDNALEYIAKVARPEDWVVLKIDIDNSDVEMQLLERILQDTTISSLIDELFFEHHVDVEPMLKYWGRNPLKLSDTYTLFHRLRNLGILAHSWV